MTKLQYFLKSVRHFNSSKRCPYCASENVAVIDRKYFVTTLNECKECRLFFRHPLDSQELSNNFYQEEYEETDGITTDLPGDESLQALLGQNFRDSTKDCYSKILTVKMLLDSPPYSLVDYGANWGYTSFQFRSAGFDVQPYEISVPRAKFGRKLGLDICTDVNKLQGNVDIFYNAHVIEHLPDIREMFLLAQKLLKPDGYFVCYCPNGSETFRKQHEESFHRLWGQIHPNLISSHFFTSVFKDVPYLVASEAASDTEIRQWDKNCQLQLDVSGTEIFVFAKLKNQQF